MKLQLESFSAAGKGRILDLLSAFISFAKVLFAAC